MAYQALSLTTPSTTVIDPPATPIDYVFPCDVRYDFGGGGGGTIIDPITPPAPTGSTLTVGTGQTYPNIQAALDVAVNGDRLLLTAETFTIPSPVAYTFQAPGTVDAVANTVTYSGTDIPTLTKVRFSAPLNTLNTTVSVANATTDILTVVMTAPAWSNGTKFRFTAGTPPTGLSLGVDYWVINFNGVASFQVSLSYNGPFINFTGTQTGATVTTQVFLPSPLVVNTDYWTIRQSATSSKLATSVANALANSEINLTDQGTGAQTMTVQGITVDKQVTIQGASRATTIIQSAGTTTDAVVLLTVQTSNFVIQDCTVKHKKTSNTSIEAAISVIGYSNTTPLQTATGGSATTMAVSGTVIAAGSNGQSLPQASINVASTSLFAASGSAVVSTSAGQQTVTYTGKTSASTTIAVGSNGQSLPQGTINVSSAAAFLSAGTLRVTTSGGVQTVTYTGKTATSFTGCSGGTGTMSTGGAVAQEVFTGCSGGTGTMSTSGTVQTTTGPWLTSQWVGAKVTFTTGANAGLSSIVSSNTVNLLTFPAFPNPVASGDTYAVIPMNVYFENVAVENVEFAIVMRCDNWQINNCHLAYVGPNNSTRRLIGVYRSDGQGLFTNSTYDSGQNGVITGNTRVFTVLSTVGLAMETLGGYLRLGYITPSNSYPMQQFFNCETFLAGATPLTFCVDNCNTLLNSTSTTIAAGSNGQVLPQATINVADTSAFASSGSVVVLTTAGSQAVTYTGKTATSFTGCTLGTGTMATGGLVTSSGETSAFVVWTQPTPTLSQCAEVNLQSNTLLNGHGKGAFALNGASGLGTPGSTTFYASGNSIALTAFLGTFATGITGSVDPAVLAQLGYDTLRWTNPSQVVTVPAGLSGLFVVDGVLLLDGYRVFVVDSGNAITSGIYSANAGAWYRSQDMVAGDDAAGDRFTVTQGTTYAGTNWLCTNSIGNGIVGTDPLVFASA